MPNDTTPAPIEADTALAQLVAAVEAETDPGWDCNSYHPSLWPALKAARAALASAAQAPQAVGMRISDTGRVSVDPVALANSPEFLAQVAAVKRLREAQAAPAAVAHQGVVVWPVMPPSKRQSPVLFEDGYAEGWAKCLDACKAALATASTAQPTPPAVVEPLAPVMTDVVGINARLHFRRGWRAAEVAHGIGIKKGGSNGN